MLSFDCYLFPTPSSHSKFYLHNENARSAISLCVFFFTKLLFIKIIIKVVFTVFRVQGRIKSDAFDPVELARSN